MKKIVTICILMSFMSFQSFADDTLEDLQREHLIDMNRKMNTVHFMAVGDIMMHMPIVNHAYRSGEYQFELIFQKLTPLFSTADFLIGNLETTLTSNHSQLSGYPRFKSPVELGNGLKLAGFDVLTTANNHSLDGGSLGLKETLDTLDNEKILHTGSFDTPDFSPVIIKEKNLTIGIVAYTYGTNGLLPHEDYYVNYIDRGKISDDYQKLIDLETDIQIISLHWGTEYQSEPNQMQLEIEAFVQELGYDVLLGSHPHVIQRDVFNKNFYAVYSMGNFLSNQRDGYKDLGVIVDLVLEKFNDEILIRNVKRIPTWVDKYQEGRIDYRIINLNESKETIDNQEIGHIRDLKEHFEKIYK